MDTYPRGHGITHCSRDAEFDASWATSRETGQRQHRAAYMCAAPAALRHARHDSAPSPRQSLALLQTVLPSVAPWPSRLYSWPLAARGDASTQAASPSPRRCLNRCRRQTRPPSTTDEACPRLAPRHATQEIHFRLSRPQRAQWVYLQTCLGSLPSRRPSHSLGRPKRRPSSKRLEMPPPPAPNASQTSPLAVGADWCIVVAESAVLCRSIVRLHRAVEQGT